jgi:molybdate transport repressor ModE-like protein
MAKNKSKFSYKIWLEYEGKPLIGKGGAQILEEIEKEKSISKAAEKLDMSYRYVWSYLQRIRKALGEPVVETYRGGKMGGGGAKLTKQGKKLLEDYKRIEAYFAKVFTGKY